VSAGQTGVFELVDFGMIANEVQYVVDRCPGQCTIAFGAVHQPHEYRVVAHDEGRDPEYVHCPNTALMLLADHRRRPPRVDLGQHGIGIDTGPSEGGVHYGPVAQVGTFSVAAREQ
jgi:hypothetical protein